MQIKYKHKGIVARPGVHNRGDILEQITAELLRQAIPFQPRIPLIVGPHPPGGRSNPNDWIGHVEQKWNATQQRVDGEFLFYREHWDKVPVDIQRRLNNKEVVKLSAGYEIGDLVEDVQRGRKYDHLALNVHNPMHEDVGVNVRMESELPDNFRIEQEAQIGEEEEPEDKETVKPAPTSVTFTDEQFKQLLEAIRPVVPEPPVVSETKVEEEVIEEVQVEPSTPIPPEPRMEPEKVIPRGTAPSEADYATNDDTVAVSIEMLGEKAKK